ncbi:MAG: Rne/Rng family ribonuclease [Deltaproteobacteria bacterium]|nr:Rne/Rng family ribonuclease [Deltaproteobacteria bacterium]
MTEGKPKRSYWRRGPRKKKGAEDAAGTAATTPQLTEGGDSASESEVSGAPETGEPFAPPPAPEFGEAGFDAAPAEASAEAAESASGETEAGSASTGEVPAKGRRRSRRRGKKKPGDGTAAESAEGVGETQAPAEEPRPSGDVGWGGQESPARRPFHAPAIVEVEPAEGEMSAAPMAGPPGTKAEPGAEPGGEPGEPGKRRRRRRRRRRGKGKGPGQGEAGGTTPAAAGDEEPEADDMGALAAGGTEAEEPDAGPEDMNEADEEEEESFPEEGTGAKKVMLIDGLHSEENRVAIVAEGNLDYYEVENQRRKAFKGNIYKAKVVNIAHAIEAAFVEFGGGRHGFLPLNEYCAGALMEHLGDWNEGDKRPPLRPGMEILVQVTKEESTIKGAAVTSYISIAGRYMVMMLGMKRYGISKKITGEKERERIRKQMEKLEYPDHLGFIVRTVGAARPLKDLKADLTNLLKLWDRTVEGARANKAPALLYEEQDIVIRTLRDNYSADVTEVLMNSEAAYRKASAFFDVYYPKEKGKLKLYRNKRPLFGKFNLEEQVERGTQRKVPLPSGGHIVIDRSEALWAIDVNSGRSSKDRDIEDTAFRTNGEAAAEVTRQLRLRDIGGLIVIDFIDMESKSHNKEVERILKEGLKRDKAKSDVTSLGKFGLVAISRQRMGTSFYDILLKGCDLCGGTGVIPTQDAATVRLLRRLHDELSKEGREAGQEVSVRVAPGLLETLLNQKRDDINRLEKLCGGKVAFHADPTLSASSFSIENETAK